MVFSEVFTTEEGLFLYLINNYTLSCLMKQRMGLVVYEESIEKTHLHIVPYFN